MDPFLAGFCSELTKLAFESGTPTPTPVPATGAPTSQRPTGAAAAVPRPGGTAGRPITGPVLGSGVEPAPSKGWRPSPTYSPKASAAEPGKPKAGGGKRGPSGPDRMPWGPTEDLPGAKPRRQMSKAPTGGVAPGQRAGVTNKTTNKDLVESGAMPRAAYNKLDPREQTSSHVPQHGPYTRPVRDQLTNKQYMSPSTVDRHTGRQTPRGEYEQDHPAPMRGFGSQPAPKSGIQQMSGGADPAMSKYIASENAPKVGPGDSSWGGESADTWQNRSSQFAVGKSLLKDKGQ